jgi:hypothetical protein
MVEPQLRANMGIRAHPGLTSGTTSVGHHGTQSWGCAGQTVRPSPPSSCRPRREAANYLTVDQSQAQWKPEYDQTAGAMIWGGNRSRLWLTGLVMPPPLSRKPRINSYRDIIREKMNFLDLRLFSAIAYWQSMDSSG